MSKPEPRFLAYLHQSCQPCMMAEKTHIGVSNNRASRFKSQTSDKSLAKNDDLEPRELFVYIGKKYLPRGAIITLSARIRQGNQYVCFKT